MSRPLPANVIGPRPPLCLLMTWKGGTKMGKDLESCPGEVLPGEEETKRVGEQTRLTGWVNNSHNKILKRLWDSI